MSDSFTRFCAEVPAVAADEWFPELVQLLALPDEASPFGDPDDGGYIGALPSVDRVGDAVWVKDRGGVVDVDAAARVIQWMLGQPDTPDSVIFEIANTSATSEPGAFSGAVAKVTADGFGVVHTSDLQDLEPALDRWIGRCRAKAETRTDG